MDTRRAGAFPCRAGRLTLVLDDKVLSIDPLNSMAGIFFSFR